MAEGEFESMKMLDSVSPEMVPKPIGYGTYEANDDIHFFLCEFVDLYDELPDVVDFCQGITDLHRKSMKYAPDSRFGFKITTCNETIEQYTKWTSSWEAFFVETLKVAFELEEQVHQPSLEILEMQPALYEKVCPRLLRPLETEGRTLRPCLVHGDLWDGNTAVRARTGQPVIFDASALWAHNEYELHIWRGGRYKMGKTFVREYFNHFPISPPEDDWQDRNLLYSLVADLHSSTLFKHTEKFRDLVIQSMRELVEKFPNGYEGPAKRKDDEKVNVGDEQLTNGKIPCAAGPK
jgi:fructosamine-3-kinase